MGSYPSADGSSPVHTAFFSARFTATGHSALNLTNKKGSHLGAFIC